MNNEYLLYAIPTFFILIFIEALYSHLKDLKLYNLRNSLSGLACGLFTTSTEVFSKAAFAMAYIWISEHFAISQLPDSHWATWIAALIIFDFIWYWAHRYSHEINLLWAGHVPHHHSEEFNLSTGLRQGALQDLMFWPLYITMAFIGFSVEMFFAHLLINKFYGFWLHTKAINKIPLIEGILSTPSAHRVHHGMNDEYLDKNYGGIFMIFDRMFGTYQKEVNPVIFGVRKRYSNYNPVSAHFEWLHAMWQDAVLAANTWDKFKIWFKPTGWRPADVALKYPRVKFSASHYQKLDCPRQPYPIMPMLTLFSIIAAANLILLFSPELTMMAKAALLAFITLSLIALGKILNNSKQAEASNKRKIISAL